MANRTLTFSGNKFSVTATVNGVSVTSPYELTESCTIVITPQNGDYASWRLNGSNITTSYPEYYLEDVDVTFYDAGGGIPGPPEGYITIHYTHAPSSSGYTITFNSNGGSTISDITEATQLPSELPIPTKARNTFVGWYYDSTLKQKAKPNDMINTNVTLYAKWYDSLSAFYTDIANLIREFENSSDNIKVTDFADRLRALLESV
jgi:uncharacterized repeat protein (TIGR02543 family)